MQVQYQMEDLTVGQKVTGTVKAVHDFGVFVDIGAPRDALLNTERFAVSLKGHRLLGCESLQGPPGCSTRTMKKIMACMQCLADIAH